MPSRDESEPRRRGDVDALQAARAQGFKDAEQAAFNRATTQHFAAINGSIERFAKALEGVRDEVMANHQALDDLRDEQAGRDRVNQALAGALAGTRTRRRTVLQNVLALLMLAVAVTAVILPYVIK